MTHQTPVPVLADVPPCRAPGVDPEIFFPDRKTHLDEARAVCGSCTRATGMQCLRYAIEHDVSGIWAGSTYAQREEVRERRHIKAKAVIGYQTSLTTHRGRHDQTEQNAAA